MINEKKTKKNKQQTERKEQFQTIDRNSYKVK